jgi:hypothetical protein
MVVQTSPLRREELMEYKNCPSIQRGGMNNCQRAGIKLTIKSEKVKQLKKFIDSMEKLKLLKERKCILSILHGPAI